MPQMGVSVAEGTRRRVAEAGRRLGRAPTRSSARSPRTRSTRTWSRPATGRVRGDPRARSARPSRSAPCWPRSRPTPRPGAAARRPRRRVAPRTARARPSVALEAAGEAGELQGDTADEDARRPRRRRAPAAVAPAGRRYSPVVMRMAAEHDLDLVADRGHRPRRARAQAGRAGVPRVGRRGGRRAPSRRCTSSRPTSPTSRRRRSSARRASAARRSRSAAGRPAGTGGRCRACAQSIGRAMVESLQTAATCTTIVEADMTRVEAGAQAARRDLPADRRARDDRDAARVPGAQRDARGRRRTPGTSAVHLGIAVSLGRAG